MPGTLTPASGARATAGQLPGYMQCVRPFALLDASNGNDAVAWSALLYDLQEEIICRSPEQLAPSLKALEACLTRGLHVVGLFHYELGHALQPRIAPLDKRVPQLFRALAFNCRVDLDSNRVDEWLEAGCASRHEPSGIAGIHHSLSPAQYREAFGKVQQYIADGDCYQVNLTYPVEFDTFGDPLVIYRSLRKQQQVSYGAFIALGDQFILSFSPELFVQHKGQTLVAKPMKGTIRRGRDTDEDLELRHALAEDEKNRAEHIMIVDLLRNDLGRLARIGGVCVDRLFEVEEYKTLFQMTSTVRAEVPATLSLGQALEALFPCGSVTGAPKIRAMEIIAELETGVRGLYCGAIGTLSPVGDFCLNVPIRTLVVDANGKASMGVGSAIVYDSSAADEYRECALKAHFLTGVDPGFQLIETIRYERIGFVGLEEHLARLAASAAYFGFRYEDRIVRTRLNERDQRQQRKGCWKVRLLLSKCGAVSIEQTPIELEPIRKQVAISAVRTNSRNVLLQHKTTARAVYEREYSQAQSRGLFDVLFVNERGEVTEASRANVFVRLNGGWYTPPVSSGLLGGLMRERVLSNPRRGAGERIIHAEELRLAERIVLTNAIYRITEVELVSSDRFETAGNDRSPRGGLQEAREGIQTGGGL